MNYLKSKLIAIIVAFTLFVLPIAGCVTTTVGPDGTTVVSEPDYQGIQMLATVAVAGWAASQKNGVTKHDAEVMVAVLDAIVNFRADGSPIVEGNWAPVIAEKLPPRYQALGMAVIQLTEYELTKYGVATQIPTPDSTSFKIVDAIVKGAKLGLAPYLTSYQLDELMYGIPTTTGYFRGV